MVLILPVSLTAQEAAAAMLVSSGVGVLIDNNNAPASIALFPKNVIETQKNAAARIEMTGSTADINPETVLEFQIDELVLDHGSLSVHTSKGLRVRVGCITVTPVHETEWTEYDVSDLDGKVTVRANQDDVYIDAHSKNPQDLKKPDHAERSLVRQGEQKTREEKCAGAYFRREFPGLGSPFDSPWAVGAGIGIIVGITCFALCRTNPGPLSPSCPSTGGCTTP
jgi:hypothetical protein